MSFQFAQDETTTGTTPLTSMTIDIGTSDPVLQKTYPIAMKALSVGERRD